MKITKGQWRYFGKRLIRAEDDTTSIPIAEIITPYQPRQHIRTTEQEMHANARLMCAAPKMLEILQEILKDNDLYSHEHHHEICSRNTECDEALEAEEECICHDDCPECECGLVKTQAIMDKARKLLKELK